VDAFIDSEGVIMKRIDIGKTLRKYRRLYGITQAYLARKVGLSRRTIINIEGGHEPSRLVEFRLKMEGVI
jgi:DNA-binding XRE family transcriptional regulator